MFNATGCEAPDVDEPQRLVAFFVAVQQLAAQGRILAYHDRSDGGLFATLAEMAFATHCGIALDLDTLCDGSSSDVLRTLFAEELGAVLQVRSADLTTVRDGLRAVGLDTLTRVIGAPLSLPIHTTATRSPV